MLLSYERELLAHFVLQSKFERLAILTAATLDTAVSGPLLSAYKWVSENA